MPLYETYMANRGMPQLDELYAGEAGERRLDTLAVTFAEAVRLEISFWDMGLNIEG